MFSQGCYQWIQQNLKVPEETERYGTVVDWYIFLLEGTEAYDGNETESLWDGQFPSLGTNIWFL